MQGDAERTEMRKMGGDEVDRTWLRALQDGRRNGEAGQSPRVLNEEEKPLAKYLLRSPMEMPHAKLDLEAGLQERCGQTVE